MSLVPQWADPEWSKELLVVCARGEGQELEFIESFPNQAQDLGKEIAAFATSNTGSILLGVSDAGEIKGLQPASTASERDAFVRRIEGICHGRIKPSITPTVSWAWHNGCAVLVITVPKGSQPVYYSNDKPYLRHLTESRPAEPHEVVELVRRHLAAELRGTNAVDDEGSIFYSDLARVFATIETWAAASPDQKHLTPWLEQWRADFAHAAAELRQLAVKDVATGLGLRSDLVQLAEAVEAVASVRLYIGCGPELDRLEQQAVRLAASLKARTVSKIPLSDESVAQVRTLLRENARRLSDLSERAEHLADAGRIEEVQTSASEVGRALSRLAVYNLDVIRRGLHDELRAIGTDLASIEAIRLYADGGRSMRTVVERVQAAGTRFGELMHTLQ